MNLIMKLQILTSAPKVPVKTTDPVQTWSTTTIAIVFLDSTEQIVKTVRRPTCALFVLIETP